MSNEMMENHDDATENNDDATYSYEFEGDGVVITRCIAHAARVRVPRVLGGAAVVAIGDESFASSRGAVFPAKLVNDGLEEVLLPEGLSKIGRAAFRGCNRLVHVELPASLCEISDLAFSCTSLTSLRLPRACEGLSQMALRTGPESLTGARSPYRSKLDTIEVEAGNAAFCVSGGALCRRLDGGLLEAVLCPGRAERIDLGRDVVSIAPTAFAGTYAIGTLAFNERVSFAQGCGLPSDASCERVEVGLANSIGEVSTLSLDMPSFALQHRVFQSTIACPELAASRALAAFDGSLDDTAFDLAAFLGAYDAAIVKEDDWLLRAKLMLARLATPICLDGAVEASFRRALIARLDELCVSFGARGSWGAFDDMADAGLLDSRSIAHAVDVLTAHADAAGAAYLIELKRVRGWGGGFDYGL